MPQINNLASLVAKMRTELQPHFTDNVDPMIFDYDFLSQLETLVKKEREKAKAKLISYADKPEDFAGVLIRTASQQVTLKVSAPPQQFSLELFIDLVAAKCKIDKHILRELSTEAVVNGTPRRTYSVEQIG